LEGRNQFWRRIVGRKSIMCKEKMDAKEERIEGAHVGKPNHVRVRVLESDCND